jgi:hypothetical protein
MLRSLLHRSEDASTTSVPLPTVSKTHKPGRQVAKRESFEKRTIRVRRHEVVTYSPGAGDETVLLLNGGPGLACDDLREPHARQRGSKRR